MSPPASAPLSSGSISSRRPRPTRGSPSRRRHRRLALPRHADRDDGRSHRLLGSLEGLVARSRSLANGVPLYAGFGISTPEQAAAAASLADGTIVGSRAVQVAEDGPQALGRTSLASRSTRRLRPETFAGQRGTVQWFTRTRLPQRVHRARRCVSRNRFASGTRWPSTRQRYRLTPPGRPARASFRCSPRPASR